MVEKRDKYKIPAQINTKNAFLIYAEDEKINSLFHGPTIYRNPTIKSISKQDSTLLHLDDENCFELEGKLHELWKDIRSLQSKEAILAKYGKKNFEVLSRKGMICERIL